MSDPPGELEVRRLGCIDFEATRDLQLDLLERRVRGEIPDQLLILEHPEIITLGRRTPPSDWTRVGVPVIEIERGGEATWHGPGQLVAYPIIALPEGRRDLHRYLRDLEQVVIDMLADLGCSAERREGLTGVWVGAQKLCSIGVAVRRWVTWHGFSLNVDCDLSTFQKFAPCGLDPNAMGRVVDHAQVPEEDRGLTLSVERHFRRCFHY